MKYLHLSIFLIIGFGLLSATDTKSPEKEGNLVGVWTNDFDEAIMEFKKEGKTYVGILLKPAKGHELDENGNPRKYEKIIKDLVYKDGKYVNGEIYVTKFDKYMDCDIQPNGDTFKLTIRYGIMKRTVEWRRIK
jgi:uncharacterized protein (DUF2147 family)